MLRGRARKVRLFLAAERVLDRQQDQFALRLPEIVDRAGQHFRDVMRARRAAFGYARTDEGIPELRPVALALGGLCMAAGMFVGTNAAVCTTPAAGAAVVEAVGSVPLVGGTR